MLHGHHISLLLLINTLDSRGVNATCIFRGGFCTLVLFISVATVAINIMGDVLEGESAKVCAVVIDPEGDCPVKFSFEVNITYQYSNGMDQPGGIMYYHA